MNYYRRMTCRNPNIIFWFVPTAVLLATLEGLVVREGLKR
jgi:hypothetical protein